MKILADGCALHSSSRKQKARAHSSAEAEYYAGAAAASEAMYLREVFLHAGFEVRTELIMDSAAARGICRREGVGAIRHLSTKVLWLQQLVKRGVIAVGSTPGSENIADLGTKCLPADRLIYLRRQCGIFMEGEEHLVAAEAASEEENGGGIATVANGRCRVMEALGRLLEALAMRQR